eukprot:347160-Chlamydomonas_euryale.AAC.1
MKLANSYRMGCPWYCHLGQFRKYHCCDCCCCLHTLSGACTHLRASLSLTQHGNVMYARIGILLFQPLETSPGFAM